MTGLPRYEVVAIRLASRSARRDELFIGESREATVQLDDFVWALRDGERIFLVDCGYGAQWAAQHGRTLHRSPGEALGLIGINAPAVGEIIVTHMHADRIGAFAAFPAARFHVQDEEMAFATGRSMRHRMFSDAYEPGQVAGLVRLVFGGRVAFHDGDDEVAPGLTLHPIGGRTRGLQVVRVHTRRGWIVLASGAARFYEHLEAKRGDPGVVHLGEQIQGYDRLARLADSPDHIIPGNDPLVLARYPAHSPALRAIAVRLDAEPAGKTEGKAASRRPP